MAELGKRLSLAASFVKTGSRVCDVGTDHGYLPVFLLKSGKAKTVCATEINKKPLENALKTFKKEGVRIPLYLADGLDGVESSRIDTVIITGMGGEVISGIIERAPFLKKEGVSLILQPMTAAGELRDYLAQNGFSVLREKAVIESSRVYSVMLAEYSGVVSKIGAAERRIGLLKPDSEDNLVYIKRQHRLCAELCESIKGIPEKKALFESEKAALLKIEQLIKA